MPEDVARESELPSQADSEQGQSDDGRDAPGSQNVPARALLLRRAALRWNVIVHGGHPAMARIAAMLRVEERANGATSKEAFCREL